MAGLALLFLPEAVLPRLVSGYPAAALWVGQLLGVAWLGLATLNWGSRSTVLGGIYGRPVVSANLAVYVMGALVLLKAARRAEGAAALWLGVAAAGVLATAYGWLLFRGPLSRDLHARGMIQGP